MNSNLFKRTLTCIFGIAFLFAITFFLPMHNFIGLTVAIAVLTLLGSAEMSKIVLGKVCFPVYFSWIYTVLPQKYAEYYLFLLILTCFAVQIKKGEKDNFKTAVNDMAKLLSVSLYPAFFMRYAVKFFSLENVNAFVIFLYLVLVFSNDIFAYVFGMLLGKNNRGIFKVSPKKSIAGFIGGFISCIGMAFLFCFVCRNNLPSIGTGEKLLLGILMSLLADIGDLLESSLKRSADIKDSGTIIPGRGGVLDSIDSICATAPVIFFIFRDIIL